MAEKSNKENEPNEKLAGFAWIKEVTYGKC